LKDKVVVVFAVVFVVTVVELRKSIFSDVLINELLAMMSSIKKNGR
jgi:hypothetical protein